MEISFLVPILKPGKDGMFCASYRPITLLNVDARLFTSILSMRLQKIVTKYIKQDQMGFIPGRLMADNIRQALNIIQYGKTTRTSYAILLLDFEKAFDSIEFTYILALLKHMNFGEGFLRAVTALYDTPSAKLKIDGTRSAEFSINRGTQ